MIITGDALAVLKHLNAKEFNCCVTSPPYWALRDYNMPGQMGLEATPDLYIKNMVTLFREVRRVLRDDGTLWVNIGDTYNSVSPGARDKTRWPKQSRNDHRAKKIIQATLKPKDLVGIPWMLAFALRADGWYLRQDIIWSKPNPMPESVLDRCTKAHEYIFLLSKSEKYYFNAKAISEEATWKSTVPSNWAVDSDAHDAISYNTPGSHRKNQPKRSFNGKTGDKAFRATGDQRHKRSVWTVPTQAFRGAHFATFPEDLIRPCILAGCPAGGHVLDPFLGSGTTALVAKKNGCRYTGIELNPDYVELAQKRIAQGYLFT